MTGGTAEDGAQSSEQTGAASSDGCCETLPAVDEELLVDDVQLLSALGNDTRYELVRRIGAAEGGVCVCDLEAAVGLSQSAVSQALSRLYSAGLVSRRKDGAWRYYELTADAEQLLETLDGVRTTNE